MSSAIIEEDGLITLPDDVRDRLQLVPGSQVEFVVSADGRLFIRRYDGDATA